jgi:hypothetical protein
MWREANREKHNRLARESHHRNKHKHVGAQRAAHLRRNYGITQDEYLRMEASQGGRCAICGTEDKGKWQYLHVDHCHATGKVRGLLCVKCNTALGWFELYGAKISPYLEGT